MTKIIVYTFIITVNLCVCTLFGYCADATNDGFIYDSKGRRDPFIPLVGQEKSVATSLETIVTPDELKLEGIAIGAGGKQIAILNGQIVKDKDKFGVILIKKISRKSVEISIEGVDYTLNLQEPEKENASNKQ